MKAVFRALSEKSWIWPLVGSIVLWSLLGLFSGGLNLESLIAISTTASFLAIVAMGQMIVITTGGGAIDLSIPSVITLAAFVSTGMINGSDANLIYVIPFVLVIGAAIGFLNSINVLFLNIPPIIATLGMSYIVTTAILLYNRNFRAFDVSPLLLRVSRNRVFGVLPTILIVALVLVTLLTFLLRYTKFGRNLIALGQNVRAARLAGVNVVMIQSIAYMFSGVLAAFGGIMIAARVGGAFLGLGDPYLLQSVASVVVGGSLISGGRAVPLGTLIGSLFLTILVTTMQVAGMRIGGQNILTGLLIILVLFIASKKSVRAE